MATKKMSREEIKVVSKVWNALESTFDNLYARWQEEKQYESIEDYGKVIAKKLPKGFKFVKMTSRPFRAVFIYKAWQCAITLERGGKEYSWGAIPAK